ASGRHRVLAAQRSSTSPAPAIRGGGVPAVRGQRLGPLSPRFQGATLGLMASCSACGTALAEGARFCSSCGAPLATFRRLDERKLATILFADLVGSTALADSEDPERNRAVLTRFYEAMAEEIEIGGGTLDKFIGDGVLAVFGAPTALEDHAERAVRVAMAMRSRLTDLFAG